MKTTRRQRYIVKWNGPDSWKRLKKCRRYARATMGKGDEIGRSCATAYVCRFQGWFPKTVDEFDRACGCHRNRKKSR